LGRKKLRLIFLGHEKRVYVNIWTSQPQSNIGHAI